MAEDVSHDQLALIRVNGMHSHTCEKDIQRSILQHAGVREVEVDFLSGQISVLFDRESVTVAQIVEQVRQAGYPVISSTQRAIGT